MRTLRHAASVLCHSSCSIRIFSVDHDLCNFSTTNSGTDSLVNRPVDVQMYLAYFQAHNSGEGDVEVNQLSHLGLNQ